MTHPLTYKRPVEDKPQGTCGSCLWWTPPTAFFHGVCRNTKSFVSKPTRDSGCSHHEFTYAPIKAEEQEEGKK